MTTAKPNILELAKQSNPKAIEALLEQGVAITVEPRRIRVRRLPLLLNM